MRDGSERLGSTSGTVQPCVGGFTTEVARVYEVAVTFDAVSVVPKRAVSSSSTGRWSLGRDLSGSPRMIRCCVPLGGKKGLVLQVESCVRWFWPAGDVVVDVRQVRLHIEWTSRCILPVTWLLTREANVLCSISLVILVPCQRNWLDQRYQE